MESELSEVKFKSFLRDERERLGVTAQQMSILCDDEYSTSTFEKWLSGEVEPRKVVQDWILTELEKKTPEDARVFLATREKNAAMAALATKAHQRK